MALLLFVPCHIRETCDRFAEKYGLDGDLVCAVIKTESGFKKDSVSTKGACGLMQIMPETFDYITEKFGLNKGDIFVPENNIEAGCAYLSYLFDEFETEKETLCAYNAGEGTVREWLCDPVISSDGKTLERIPYKETEKYIAKISFYKNLYKGS